MKLTVSLLAFAVCASGAAIDTFVNSKAMPWESVHGGLNTAFQFGTGNGSGPDVLNAIEGVNLIPGRSLALKYLSGFVSTCDGCPYVDANGWIGAVPTNAINDKQKLSPSAYMSDKPVYLMALVGVFANDSGNVVGSPFFIGDGSYIAAVPEGATRLQLGINDNDFHDNSGLFRIQVSGPAITGVPEPVSLALLGLGIVVVLVVRRRWKTKLIRTLD